MSASSVCSCVIASRGLSHQVVLGAERGEFVAGLGEVSDELNDAERAVVVVELQCLGDGAAERGAAGLGVGRPGSISAWGVLGAGVGGGHDGQVSLGRSGVLFFRVPAAGPGVGWPGSRWIGHWARMVVIRGRPGV